MTSILLEPVWSLSTRKTRLDFLINEMQQNQSLAVCDLWPSVLINPDQTVVLLLYYYCLFSCEINHQQNNASDLNQQSFWRTTERTACQGASSDRCFGDKPGDSDEAQPFFFFRSHVFCATISLDIKIKADKGDDIHHGNTAALLWKSCLLAIHVVPSLQQIQTKITSLW